MIKNICIIAKFQNEIIKANDQQLGSSDVRVFEKPQEIKDQQQNENEQVIKKKIQQNESKTGEKQKNKYDRFWSKAPLSRNAKEKELKSPIDAQEKKLANNESAEMKGSDDIKVIKID